MKLLIIVTFLSHLHKLIVSKFSQIKYLLPHTVFGWLLSSDKSYEYVYEVMQQTYSSKFFVVFVDFSLYDINSGDLLIFNRETWRAVQKSR